MQVFAFGHSITQGFWDTEGGWVQRLRKFLDQKSLAEPEKYWFNVYNLGVSGNDSGQLLERFEDEIERRISEDSETVIILQIGANDIQYLAEEDRIKVLEEEFRSNLGELIEKARTYTDRIVFVGETYTTIEGPIPWAEDKHLDDERLGRYVEIQREVCETEDIPYVDLRELRDKKEWSEMLEDGSHPDNEGHQLIYEEVKERLVEEELLGL